ncbi:hypothetical protein BKA93DRAFT_826679 [Sparassis latifolia]
MDVRVCASGLVLVFHPMDENALAVLTYAVDHLRVSYVIVAGHTQCGGAAASHSVEPPTMSPARWLAPLTALALDTHTDALPNSSESKSVSSLLRLCIGSHGKLPSTRPQACWHTDKLKPPVHPKPKDPHGRHGAALQQSACQTPFRVAANAVVYQ